MIVDRRWDLVTANAPALAILGEGVAPELLAPPANAMRVCLHPDGLAPRIRNLGEYGEHLVDRLARQAAITGDPEVVALLEELRGYARRRRARAATTGRPGSWSCRSCWSARRRAAPVQHAGHVRHGARRDDRRAGDRVVLPGGRRDGPRRCATVRLRSASARRRPGSGRRPRLCAAEGRPSGGGPSPAQRGTGIRALQRGCEPARGSRRTGGGASRRDGPRRGGAPAAIGFGGVEEVERAVHWKAFRGGGLIRRIRRYA